MGIFSNKAKISTFLAIGLSIFIAHLFQPKLLYFPRRYDVDEGQRVRETFEDQGFTFVKLTYLKEGSGRRYSYLAFPGSIKASNLNISLYMLFGGNGMTAFDWSDWVIDITPHIEAYPNVAFLLIDYPGYGENTGDPSPISMNECAEKSFRAAVDVLKVHGMSPLEINVLGHSIGAAVASKWIAESEGLSISRLVLSAPFTSITDMVSVVFPLVPRVLAGLVSRHDWDNRKSLNAILEKTNVRNLFIVHGMQDTLVPPTMGNELSKIANCSFIPVPHASHNDVISAVKLLGFILSTSL